MSGAVQMENLNKSMVQHIYRYQVLAAHQSVIVYHLYFTDKYAGVTQILSPMVI